MPIRFQEDDTWLSDFSQHVLVECPRCRECAEVRATALEGEAWRVTLACTHCGEIQRRETTVFTRPAYVDGYFHCPLWLQTPCVGQVLWAYNAAHLAFLEGYIGADLRERSRGAHGWRNSNLVSRLPKWMQQANHRKAVLRGLKTLREKVEDAP